MEQLKPRLRFQSKNIVLEKLFEGMSDKSHASAMKALGINWKILSNVAASEESDVKRSLQSLNDSIALPLDSVWACNVVFLAMMPDEAIEDPDILQILKESRLMIPIDCWEIDAHRKLVDLLTKCAD